MGGWMDGWICLISPFKDCLQQSIKKERKKERGRQIWRVIMKNENQNKEGDCTNSKELKTSKVATTS